MIPCPGLLMIALEGGVLEGGAMVVVEGWGTTKTVSSTVVVHPIIQAFTHMLDEIGLMRLSRRGPGVFNDHMCGERSFHRLCRLGK
jgi:hypothetical protein